MKTRILMVCLGNICRSPLAESILSHKLPSKDFIIDSAGTGSWHIGKKPAPRSVAIASKNNIDITYQRGRQIDKEDFKRFDIIYTMDLSVHKDVLELAPDQASKDKVKMILNEIFPGENMDVPDPYAGPENGFSMVYKMLEQSCEQIAKNLLSKS